MPSKTTPEISTPPFGLVRRSGEHPGAAVALGGGTFGLRATEIESEFWPKAKDVETMASEENAARHRIIIHQPDLLLLES